MTSTDKTMKDKIEEQIKLITEKTGVDGKIVLGVGAFLILMVLIGTLAQEITTLVGVVYPAFWSLKAIESKETNDDKLWLTYWAVFGCFTILDMVSGVLASIIPFYFFLKLGFLMWCFLPNTRGAQIIYDTILKQFFKKYEKRIEESLENIVQKGGKLLSEGVDEAKKIAAENKEAIANAAVKGATKVNEMTN